MPSLSFESFRESEPGPKVRRVFERFWPDYRAWYLREGHAKRPSYATCRRALREHMPELEPAYDAIVELAGGGDVAARFLSLYCPPQFLSGCTQATWSRGEDIALVRNYDYAPDLCDGVVLHSSWCGAPVIAMMDCLWGALDGINAEGLAVALAFGGRKVVGTGFGVPLILRYILEVAGTTREATDILERVPVHMAYTISVVDQRGEAATVFVGPDRPGVVTAARACTNHQQRVEWPEHAELTQTVERLEFVEHHLAAQDETLPVLIERFAHPPLFRTSYDRGWGTLYTSVYRPRERSIDLHWPDHTWLASIDQFDEVSFDVSYGEAETPRR